MILRLAIRSLGVRPIRTAVLACGFGLGIAVMAELLGVGEVILDQARSPALQGGGDVIVSGAFGPLENARYLLTTVLGSKDLAPRVAAASPSSKATLYLIGNSGVVSVSARGGVPSLEKAVGDREVRDAGEWVDTEEDRRWTHPNAGDLLRTMDRFHARPVTNVAPEFAASWAEWLYFNGRTADGRARFYLTFLVSPADRGAMIAGVRLQLERDGRTTSYSAVHDVDERELLARAPDIDVGDNRVRLEGVRYRISLRLRGERNAARENESGAAETVVGELALDATPGQSVPPAVIHGARGWLSGYVVPVLAGTFNGSLTVGGETISLDGATGYHDHNWGFWKDVRWQWGQVAQGETAFVYGRVFPPASVADPERLPGFLAMLGPDGPFGIATSVSIVERGEGTTPDEIVVSARGRQIEVRLTFTAERAVRTALAMTRGSEGSTVDFLQLAGTYRVSGRANDRPIDFTARGAAETFRPR